MTIDYDACRTAYRVTGRGPMKVLLLHALTGGPDAADTADGKKGWWAPLFHAGGPLAEERATVWTPNLLGGCYGSTGPDDFEQIAVQGEGSPGTFPAITTRDQALALAAWIRREDLRFDALVGGSLGGMVALELALVSPERFGRIGVIGCGGRADAWLWGTCEIQRAILRHPALSDPEAIALARRAAMLTFRSPESLDARFTEAEGIRDWLRHHGKALSARFTRLTYLAMLDAMDGHDLGRDRGGLRAALQGLAAPLHILGIPTDVLFPAAIVRELAEEARLAGAAVRLDWLESPHGHDAFLMEWGPVARWLASLLEETPVVEGGPNGGAQRLSRTSNPEGRGLCAPPEPCQEHGQSPRSVPPL